MTLRPTIKKILYVVLALLGVIVLAAIILFWAGRPHKDLVWGLTFSTDRAKELGFQPNQLLAQILDDLHPNKVRLPAYWSDLEPEQGKFDFSKIEGLLAETDKRNTEVVVVLGRKQPRWPECFEPAWFTKLAPAAQDQAVLNMLTEAVNRLKGHKLIANWQLENEPYFQYGPGCPAIAHDLYKQELATIRQLDPRPIIGTDSGEKGAWVTLARSGVDAIGATMYREAYYEKKGKYITYPLPWWTYNIKAGLVRALSDVNKVYGVELQAEPWLIISDPNRVPVADQLAHMNPEIFERNMEYATKVGLRENYLWGAEWWYWLAKTQNNNSMVEAAKQFFNTH